MQERYIENAIYQEAVHKISNHMLKRPDGFYDSDNIWDIYAEQFAPDATADEIEAFVGSFPDLSKDQEASYHLLPAHTVQFYGAVAVRATADNPDLQQHSAKKLTHAVKYLAASKTPPSMQLVTYTMNGLSAAGKSAEAIKAAETFAYHDGEYDPRGHARFLRSTAEAFESYASAAAHEKEYWHLSQVAIDTQAKVEAVGKNKLRPRLGTADAVLHHTITELYKHTDKQQVVDFCQEHQLYPELVAALHAVHDHIPSKTLDKAIDTAAKDGVVGTIKNLAGICVEIGEEARARRLIKRLHKSDQHIFWIELRKNNISQAAQSGDFDTAVRLAKKMHSLPDLLHAINIINEALIENGDTEAFVRVNKMLPSLGEQTTFSEYTARMAVRAGNIGQALEFASADPNTRTSWWQLAEDYIHHHTQHNTPESISIDVICSFLENDRHSEDTDLSFTYAQCFEKLHEGGHIELARELAARFRGKPGHINRFSSYLRPLAIKDVIKTGDWARAMHGDHLDNPEGGLVLSRHIILIAGGIHRARTQRKQQQKAQTIENSSNNLL